MNILTIYLGGLATGGLLLLLSFAAGADDGASDAATGDADLEASGEAELEIEEGADEATAVRGHGGPAPALATLLTVVPIASLRFWTFFLAFGGLAGTLLTCLSSLGPSATAALAAAVGYGAGVGVMALLRWLARSQVSSMMGAGACVGASGTVLLPIARGALGRIRVQLEEQVIDFDAETDDEAGLAVLEPVVVYEVRDDGVVLVTSTRAKALRTN